MPDDLRWSWCNSNVNKVRTKCNELESSQQPPLPPCLWKNHLPRNWPLVPKKLGAAVVILLRRLLYLWLQFYYKGCKSGVANEEKRVTRVKSGSAPDVKLPWPWDTSASRHIDIWWPTRKTHCGILSGFVRCFSQISLGLWCFWEEDHGGKVPFSTYYCLKEKCTV